jgi:type IV pilus assembly protein PilN
MKITLNLASHPYVDLRSVLKRLRVLMALFAVLTIPLLLVQRSALERAKSVTARVQNMQNNVRRLQQQQQDYEALMRQPKNAAVLTQADFLNGLFARKAFSWTATMTDLETVLPGGVQVLSLDPEITKSGEIVIRLRVSGGRDRAVELMHNLEKSRHFASPRLASETLAQQTTGTNNAALQPMTATTLVNLDILADYRPLTEQEEKAEANAEKKKAAQDEAKAKAADAHGASVNRKASHAPVAPLTTHTKKRGAQ